MGYRFGSRRRLSSDRPDAQQVQALRQFLLQAGGAQQRQDERQRGPVLVLKRQRKLLHVGRYTDPAMIGVEDVSKAGV